MTVIEDRIEMADSITNRDELTLDAMFEWLEKGPIPETRPEDGDYTTETKVAFGQDLDLTGTVVDLTRRTGEFPRD